MNKFMFSVSYTFSGISLHINIFLEYSLYIYQVFVY